MAETSSLIPKKTASGAAYYRTEGLGSLLRLSLILFVLAGILTGTLYAYKVYLNGQLEQQRKVLSELQEQIEPKTIDKLERLATTINNAKNLLKGHIYVTPVFDFLEKNTLPDVSFNSFTYSADKKSLTLIGEAPSYTEVSAQVKVFQNQPQISETSFSNTTLKDTGSVSFTAVINFK